MPDITIDEEFKNLLHPLDEETYAMLEDNIVRNGCRDSLVLWRGILVDGHNRYEICTKHGIPFNTMDIEFASREEALIWIITTQVARRNLTPFQLSYYRGLHYITDMKTIKNESGRNQHSEVSGQNDHKPQMKSTASRLADKYNVSPKTIRRDAKSATAIDAIGLSSPEAKTLILAGKANISKGSLEALSAPVDGEVETVAAQIKDGTYVKSARLLKDQAQAPDSASSWGDGGAPDSASDWGDGGAHDSASSWGDGGAPDATRDGDDVPGHVQPDGAKVSDLGIAGDAEAIINDMLRTLNNAVADLAKTVRNLPPEMITRDISGKLKAELSACIKTMENIYSQL